MSEALEAILAFSKNELGAKKVVAYIYPDNIASVKIAEKVGFVRSGEQYVFVFRGEEYLHDIYVLEQ